MTKSVVALVVGASIERGDLGSLDVAVGDLLDLPATSPVASATIGDVLRMRAGLDCGLDGGEPRLQEMLGSDDFVGYAAAIPAAGVRGQTSAYCSPGYKPESTVLTLGVG